MLYEKTSFITSKGDRVFLSPECRILARYIALNKYINPFIAQYLISLPPTKNEIKNEWGKIRSGLQHLEKLERIGLIHPQILYFNKIDLPIKKNTFYFTKVYSYKTENQFKKLLTIAGLYNENNRYETPDISANKASSPQLAEHSILTTVASFALRDMLQEKYPNLILKLIPEKQIQNSSLTMPFQKAKIWPDAMININNEINICIEYENSRKNIEEKFKNYLLKSHLLGKFQLAIIFSDDAIRQSFVNKFFTNSDDKIVAVKPDYRAFLPFDKVHNFGDFFSFIFNKIALPSTERHQQALEGVFLPYEDKRETLAFTSKAEIATSTS